jgi:multidrug resistance efflux pump
LSRIFDALSDGDSNSNSDAPKAIVPFEVVDEKPVPRLAAVRTAIPEEEKPAVFTRSPLSGTDLGGPPHSARKYLILAFALLALAFLGTGYALRAGPGGLDSNRQAYGVAFEGTIRPSSEIRITAEAMGTVSKILVKVGDAVQKGQPLIHMDDREARLELKRATMELDAAQESFDNFRAPLADINARVAISQRQEQQIPTRQFRDSPERAQASYDEAVVNNTRAKQLYEAGLISQQEMDLRATALRIAQDDLTNAKTLATAAATVKHDQSEQADLQARVSREELRNQLDELGLKREEAERRVDATEVRATEAGVIAEISTGLGDRVPGGTVLVRMAQLNRMVAAVPVAATMISQLHVGELAMVQVPSTPPQQVEGKIRTISPLPSANMTHLIEIEFENETRLLLAGQPTEVRFVKP